MIDLLVSVVIAASCDSGYYDPTHQICQPNLPGNPQPGYPQQCDTGYYDPTHGICQASPPAYPRPWEYT